MIAADVIHHREKQVPVLGFGEIIVSDLVRRSSRAGGDRGAARLLRRLVIRRIAHHEELVPTRGDELAELRQAAHVLGGGLLVEDPPSQRRVAQTPALLGDAQTIELAVARAHRERIERGADAEHDADRPAGDLRGQIRAVGARRVHRRQ